MKKTRLLALMLALVLLCSCGAPAASEPSMAAEAPVLILDDTTSAVDMETEKIIQKSLRELPVDCTKIIIAQRISSVKHADKILILENGKVSIGNHQTLAATNEYYRSICEFQDVKDLPSFVGNNA